MNNKIIMFEKHLIEEEKAKNTIDKYLRDVKEFYEWFNCRVKLNGSTVVDNVSLTVTKEILLEYKKHLKELKLKIATINSKIASLNSYFTYTENEDLKLKVIKCQKSLFGNKEKKLTKNEFEKLYNAAKNDIRLMLLIETIVKTGVRVSEIKYITVESLEIGKTIVNNKGKVRIILIPKKLCKLLKDYCKGFCGGGQKCISGYKRSPILSGPIFLTRNGTPIGRKQIWQMLKDLAERAYVSKEKVFPHNLRHLFAREFYKQTHDIVKLAALLGHSSIETTRIYTKETEDECREELEKLVFVRD